MKTSRSDLWNADQASNLMQDGTAPRVFDEAVELDIFERVKKICDESYSFVLGVRSWWGVGQRWARNRAAMTSDQRDVEIGIRLSKKGSILGRLLLNQTDDVSLRNAIDFLLKGEGKYLHIEDMPVAGYTYPPGKGIDVWSDKTFNRAMHENGEAVIRLTENAESEGMLSAGFISTWGARQAWFVRNAGGRESKGVNLATEAQCSITVRHPQGVGSGWAGQSSFEVERVDMNKIAEVALDKCIRSLNPVRIEPGRYQTILEPQATAAFASLLLRELGPRKKIEFVRGGPLFLGYDAALNRIRNKIGLKIVDERISLSHDPEHPIYGTHPSLGVDRVEMIRNGILTDLFSDHDNSVQEHYKIGEALFRSSLVLEGGNTSMEEMIATMQRGLLVTRFSSLQRLDEQSVLYTGLTRDGLWLVEDGKISKAVKNFRWTESPFFVFNNVAEIGSSIPVFSPNSHGRTPFSHPPTADVVKSIVVPPMKINDFSFTSTIDAI